MKYATPKSGLNSHSPRHTFPNLIICGTRLEKLIAKLILASSKEQEVVFDPFLGSGTTAVVAKKLNRHFIGIEINQEYCCWAMKRLQQAKADASIQGY